jgi:hypothetical protein
MPDMINSNKELWEEVLPVLKEDMKALGITGEPRKAIMALFKHVVAGRKMSPEMEMKWRNLGRLRGNKIILHTEDIPLELAVMALEWQGLTMPANMPVEDN